MNRLLLKEKAKELREKGKTYTEIIKELKIKIPKNTLSYWCRDIKLPSWYAQKIKKLNKHNLKMARLVALEVNKTKRKKYLFGLQKKNDHLTKKINIKTQKLLLSVLYLGEGSKYTSNQILSLGSSSPLIIKFYLKLLKNCYTIDESKFRVRIQCRFDQNINKLEEFWQKITRINPKQFYPTYIDKRTKGKPTLKKNYKGVCTVHYFSAEIQLELEFLANAIIERVI